MYFLDINSLFFGVRYFKKLKHITIRIPAIGGLGKPRVLWRTMKGHTRGLESLIFCMDIDHIEADMSNTLIAYGAIGVLFLCGGVYEFKQLQLSIAQTQRGK